MSAQHTPEVLALLAASRKAIKVLTKQRRIVFDSYAQRKNGGRREVNDRLGLEWLAELDAPILALRSAVAKASESAS